MIVTGVTRSHVPTRFDVPVRAYGCPSDTYARPTTTPIYWPRWPDLFCFLIQMSLYQTRIVTAYVAFSITTLFSILYSGSCLLRDKNSDIVKSKVALDIKAGAELSVKADIAVANIRFNPAIKSDIYLELIEKAYILLRI